MRALLFAVLLLANWGLPQAAMASPEIRITDYELEVRVDFSRGGADFPFLNEMTGRADIRFSNAGEEALVTIPVILNRLMRATAVHDGDGNALRHQSRLLGIRGNESLQVNFVDVELASPLQPGEEMVIAIEYEGQMAPSKESGMAYVQETLDPAFTIFRAETFSFPVLNEPDTKDHSPVSMGGPFTQRITVDVPVGHDGGNGGRRIADVVENGRRRVTFETATPSRVMNFAIAPYDNLSIEDVRFYYFPEDGEGAKRLVELAGRTFELLTDWFGPRRKTAEGLAFVEIPPRYGSQAIPPTIIQTASAFRDPDRSHELYHEIAHLWNVEDLDEPSPRWNEGLSTFLQLLIDDRLREQGAYQKGMAGLFDSVKRRLPDDAACAGIEQFGVASVIRGQSYSLAGLFFARLYHQQGDGLIAGYRAFYQAYKAGGARTAEFSEFLAQRLGPDGAREIQAWFGSCEYLNLIRDADDFQNFLARPLPQ